MSRLSPTYKFLRFLGFNYSEEQYGNITLRSLMRKVLITYRNAFILRVLFNSTLFEPVAPRRFRPWLLRVMGANVGKNVFIGSKVWFDAYNISFLDIEDGVHIAGECTILCHQRDLSNYKKGNDYGKLGYRREKIILKKGCMIGQRTMIMPGVSIGEGSIIGAFSLVTKDVPNWCIAFGRPAKKIRNIQS